jgi:hypothetical protein
LAGTLKEVIAPVQELTAADTRFSRSPEGGAPATLAAMLTVNNQPVGEVDSTQVQVGMVPSWSEAAKESYRRNEARLWCMDPRLLFGRIDQHNLCNLSSDMCSIDIISTRRVRLTWSKPWQ